MANPVVHFEIIGTDAPKLRTYYGQLFGWEANTDSPVVKEVSEAGNYGFVARLVTPDGSGILGGIGGGPSYEAHTHSFTLACRMSAPR